MSERTESQKEIDNLTKLEDYTEAAIIAMVAEQGVGIEGEYTTWTKQWQTALVTGLPSSITINEALNTLMMVSGYLPVGVVRVILTTGVLIDSVDISMPLFVGFQFPSLLGKYVVCIVVTAGLPYLRIYKNNVLLQTINLNTICGYTNGYTFIAAISIDGKYILVGDGGTQGIALFKGS